MTELKIGMTFSIGLHTVLVVAGMVGIPASSRPSVAPVDIITVELFTIDEITRMPSPEEPQPQPEETLVAEAKPTEPQPILAPDESIADDAVAMPDAKPRKKPEAKRRPTPRVTPRRKPRAPSRLDTSSLAALIDRSIEETKPQTESQEKDLEQRIEDLVRTATKTSIDDRAATATINAIIQNKMAQCWSVGAGAKDAGDLVVSIRLWLTPDGNLARPPEILDADRMFDPGEGFYRAAAEKARRAVMRCVPYDLPRDIYDKWREMTLNFNPSEMIRG